MCFRKFLWTFVLFQIENTSKKVEKVDYLVIPIGG